MSVQVDHYSIGSFGSSLSQNGLSSLRYMQAVDLAAGFARMSARPQRETKIFGEVDIDEDGLQQISFQESETDAAYLRQHNVHRTGNIMTVKASVDRHTDAREAEQFSRLLNTSVHNQTFVASQAETPPLLVAPTSSTWSTAAAGHYGRQQVPTTATQASPRLELGFGLGPGLALNPRFSSELDRTWNAACLSLLPSQPPPSSAQQPSAAQVCAPHPHPHHLPPPPQQQQLQLVRLQLPLPGSNVHPHHHMVGHLGANSSEGSTSASSQSSSLMGPGLGSTGLQLEGLTSSGAVFNARRTDWDGNVMELSYQQRFPTHRQKWWQQCEQEQQWPVFQQSLQQQQQQQQQSQQTSEEQSRQQHDEAYLRKQRVLENLLMPLSSQQRYHHHHHPLPRHDYYQQLTPQLQMQSETESSIYHTPSQHIINAGRRYHDPSPSSVAAVPPLQMPLQQQQLSPASLMDSALQQTSAAPPMCVLPALSLDHHPADPSLHALKQQQQQVPSRSNLLPDAQSPYQQQQQQQVPSRSNLLLPDAQSPYQQQQQQQQHHSQNFLQRSWQQPQCDSLKKERVSENISVQGVAGQQQQQQDMQSLGDNTSSRLQMPPPRPSSSSSSQQQQRPLPVASPPLNARIGSDGSSPSSAAFVAAASQRGAAGAAAGLLQWVVSAPPPQQAASQQQAPQQQPLPVPPSPYQQLQHQQGVQQTAVPGGHLSVQSQELQLRNSHGAATTAGPALSAIGHPLCDSKVGLLGGGGVLNEMHGHQMRATATSSGDAPSSVSSQGQGRCGSPGSTQRPVINIPEEKPPGYDIPGPNSGGGKVATMTAAGEGAAGGQSPAAGGAETSRGQSSPAMMPPRGGGFTSSDDKASPPGSNRSYRGKRGVTAPRYPDRRRERLLGLQKRMVEQAQVIESLQRRLKLLEEEAATRGLQMSSPAEQQHDGQQQQQ